MVKLAGHILLFLLLATSVSYADSTETNLTEPAKIKIFKKVTAEFRCICLPSLPIQDCSYSNCKVSARLKEFIEARVRRGESAETILRGLIYGYGNQIVRDAEMQALIQEGNASLAQGIISGFGEKMLARPDATGINLTLLMGAGVAIFLMAIYLLKRKKGQPADQQSKAEKEALQQYLQEIEEDRS